MRDENEPDQAAYNGSNRDKNYYLLQHIHILLLINVVSFMYWWRQNNPLPEFSYKLFTNTIYFFRDGSPVLLLLGFQPIVVFHPELN